ncbi:MAG: hypothetical protein K2M78_01680 [Lachnospiraceae bacterium]|nr:hypothetical protein [Lachnospiraceae bacterium]
MRIVYIFVEGTDDERFFKQIFKENNIKIVTYAKEKKEKINNYIKSIKSIPNCDYVLICDVDLKSLEDKKKEMIDRFPCCEVEKIIVSIAEIESWYLAGLNEKRSCDMKVKYIHKTDDITKEKFDILVPKRMHKINFMIEILKEFDIKVAMERNLSFNYCVQYFNKIHNLAVL